MSASATSVALITGAGGGIGAACARRLGAGGSAVVLVDHNAAAANAVAEEVAQGGAKAIGLKADVSSRDAVKSCVSATLAAFGRIDVLVTAAGHLDMAPLDEIEDSALSRMLDVHLKGTIMAVQEVVPAMKRQSYGRIVCISSVGALQGHVGAAHYTAAKAGILGFVNSACKELGPHGITVNSVLPGAIDTPMIRQRDEATLARMAGTPVGRIGQPIDIAHAVAYLASPEASYVNGAALIVGGGAYT